MIDYKTQQNRLFPLLASAYAFRFVGEWLKWLYTDVTQRLEASDFATLPEAHACTAGLKSMTTSATSVCFWLCWHFSLIKKKLKIIFENDVFLMVAGWYWRMSQAMWWTWLLVVQWPSWAVCCICSCLHLWGRQCCVAITGLLMFLFSFYRIILYRAILNRFDCIKICYAYRLLDFWWRQLHSWVLERLLLEQLHIWAEQNIFCNAVQAFKRVSLGKFTINLSSFSWFV